MCRKVIVSCAGRALSVVLERMMSAALEGQCQSCRKDGVSYVEMAVSVV